MLHFAWVVKLYIQALRAKNRVSQSKGNGRKDLNPVLLHAGREHWIPPNQQAQLWLEGRVNHEEEQDPEMEVQKTLQQRIVGCLLSINLLLVFFPVAIAVKYTGGAEILQFVFAGLAIIPLAGAIGDATEHVAERLGPGIGALINAVFANATELILVLFALFKGLDTLVKAAFVGSIIGNLLLVLGLALFAGGVKYKVQYFGQIASSQAATLAVFASIAMVVPTIFHSLHPTHQAETQLSLVVAVIMLLTYVISLVFQLYTHRSFFQGRKQAGTLYHPAQPTGVEMKSLVSKQEDGHGQSVSSHEEHDEPHGSLAMPIATLLIATGGVAFMSEIVTGAVEVVGRAGGLSDEFMGVVILATIGNAAEQAAVRMAMKDHVDIAIGITFGSALQIAMFSLPLCVLLSYIRPEPMTIFVSAYEVAAVMISAVIAWMVVTDGESHWFEGTMMVMVYVVLAAGFFYLPSETE